MKKFIIHLILFLLMTLLVLTLGIGGMGSFFPKTFSKSIKSKRGDVGHMHTRLKELKSSGPVDLLIIGSSHAYRGFDPRIFQQDGFKTFVLGSSAQTPLQTEVLVKKYFKKLKPKYVIFEVFPGVFCIDGVESSVDLISNGENGFRSWPMVLRINNLITYNTLLFSWFREYVIHSRFQEPICKNGECYISGGFVQRTELAEFKGRKKSKQLLEWKFRNDQMAAFGRIMEFLKKQDCKTLLLQSPLTEAFYNSYSNNFQTDCFFQSFGIPYYNANFSRIGGNNSLYYDQDHLNTRGVEQFNQLVLAIMRNRPDWVR
jgi:hypothetical protein